MKVRAVIGAGLALVFAALILIPAQRLVSHEKMLIKPKAKICYICHGDKEKVFDTSGHGKFSVTCGMCHNPHGAGQEKMLTKPAKDMCLLCHSDMKKHYMSTGHGKVELTCEMCHNPHGTPSEAKAKPKGK